MSDASAFSIAPAATPASGLIRLIAPALLVASVAYVVATAVLLPRIPDASAAIDLLLAAALPGLMVIMLLWAARPAAFPRRRRCTLVAVTLLGAVAASIVPLLLPTA